MTASAIVPTSIATPKRIAKRLQEIYPRNPLSKCQAVTAKLLRHKDWHALEEAYKAESNSAPFIADLPDASYLSLAQQQVKLLIEKMSGLDPSHELYPPKPERDSKVSYTNAEVDAMLRASKARSGEREKFASVRAAHLIAREVLAELMPGHSDYPAKRSRQEFPDIASVSVVQSLPQQIAQWWSVNVPHQPIVAKVWREMDFDADNRISVIKACTYWSSLCLHYGETINPTMVTGVTYLFAMRYASMCFLDKNPDEILALLDRALDTSAPKEKRKAASDEIQEIYHGFAKKLLDVLSRDDLNVVFGNQPDSFKGNAKECLSIFENPKSRAGTWNH